ncbi:EthD family reductase [Pelotomaculum propionicicum]|uniref:EthD family reductase n=1 Tax=Pelotomaculum propionicicum TaxID=258475 RepID=UPI003B78F295
MIKFTILYPYAEGKKFDMDYYINKHLPLCQKLIGAAFKGGGVDAGLDVGAPPAFIAIGYLLFDSLEAFQDAFPLVQQSLTEDIVNFTDIKPVMQFSEVRM